MKKCAEQLREQWPDIRFSSVWKTAPIGYEDQDSFLNAVAIIETEQQPQEVLQALRNIEQELGKDIPFHLGPRSIDLDLLLFDDLVIQEADIEIPHPRMNQRRFVLEPLLELNPDGVDPDSHEPFQKILKKTLEQRCEIVALML